jgi:SulP family sulfate permease
LIFGVIQGVTLGALLSLGMFIHRTTRPHTVELWRIPGSNVFRNPKNFPEARPVPGVLILRMDASFYFANVAFFKERLDSLLAETSRPVSLVILDASSINDLDSSAELALREVTNRLRSIGMDLCLANVKGPVLGVMRRSGFLEFLGQEHVFLDLAQAVAANRASPNQDATMRRAETLV